MKRIIILIVILLIVSGSYYIYDRKTHMYVIVKFDVLEPFDKQMNVYLKGFKIGKTVKVYPDKEFKNTYLKLKINSKAKNLPKNTTAKIERGRINGFVNLIYPDSPSISRLKNSDEIKGKITKDINSVINERFVDSELDSIVDNATNLISNANNSAEQLSILLRQINSIVRENRSSIRNTVENIEKTTLNIKEITTKLNNGIAEDNISNSANNIEEITTQINNQTLPSVNFILCEAKTISKDIQEITTGVKNTLKKRMGLIRLFFGKPIQKD